MFWKEDIPRQVEVLRWLLWKNNVHHEQRIAKLVEEVEAVKNLLFRIAKEAGVEVKFVEEHIEVTKDKKKG